MFHVKHWSVFFLYMRKISQSELNSLRLVSKSRNLPCQSPFIEELPRILWGRAPRQVKGQKWFNEASQRRTCLQKGKSHLCEFCHTWPIRIERHETYGLYLMLEDDPNRPKEFIIPAMITSSILVIKLENIIWCCDECHKGVHRTNAVNRTMKSGYQLPVLFPASNAYKIGNWNDAKYLLIDDELYEFSELESTYVDKKH